MEFVKALTGASFEEIMEDGRSNLSSNDSVITPETTLNDAINSMLGDEDDDADVE